MSDGGGDRLVPLDERFLDVLPAAVYLCDAEGVVRHYNRRAAELWGRQPRVGDADQRFCGAVRLYWPDGRHMPHDRTPMAEALRTGRPQRDREAVIERPDGSKIWVLVNIEPIVGDDGVHVGAVNIFQDITSRKRAEQEAARLASAMESEQRALAEADRRKDEFLATLAHELRNPLAPIQNALHILELAGPHEPMVEWARGVMARQVEQLVRLVDDLLDVSRITRGAIQLRKERVALARVVESAVETSRPLIEAGRHELRLSLPGEEIVLDADPTRLAQLLANLLNNAAKYTNPCGIIDVSAAVEDGHVTLRVKDNGIGIDRSLESRIFEMFTRGHGAWGADGCLGIGLAMARNLAELHGGSIDAHSEGPGKGSEFVVRLPLTSSDAEDAPASTDEGGADAVGAAARRILVVDDNVDAASSLTALLELLGHDAREAHDGERALEIAPTFAPHLVLLDIGMPGMDGYEIARRLRTMELSVAPRLVAVTGWGQDGDRERTREAGFDLHLVKPVGLEVLESIIGDIGVEGKEAPVRST